ncbi:MAG TPA: glucose 1-dehydrogenase [Anaerolineales bacterium]|jgi:NAD(P)-dependent dehydrogenase (short-subunit alcohol dehydrogenase family)
MDMTDKVALVTGGGSGIGEACALTFAQRGAKVVVADIDDDGGNRVAKAIEDKGGQARYVRTDVGQADEVEALVKETVDQFGRLDYACNNAGIGGPAASTGDYPIDGWERVIRINLTGVFFCMRYQIPAMLANDGGAIVNMASILGQVGFNQAPAYVSAKHGVLGLTKAAALDHAQQGIRVNAVCPAFIHTPLIADLEADDDTSNMLVGLHPMGRLGEPQEVADLVVWLCSDQASFVTGSAYLVDGGYVAR